MKNKKSWPKRLTLTGRRELARENRISPSLICKPTPKKLLLNLGSLPYWSSFIQSGLATLLQSLGYFICTSMNVPLFEFFFQQDLSPLLKGIQLRFFGTKQENSVSPLFQPSFPYSKALSMIISLVSTNPVRKTNGKVPVQCKLHHFSSLIALSLNRLAKENS